MSSKQLALSSSQPGRPMVRGAPQHGGRGQLVSQSVQVLVLGGARWCQVVQLDALKGGGVCGLE